MDMTIINMLKHVSVRNVLLCIVICSIISIGNSQAQTFEKVSNDVKLVDMKCSGESLQEAATKISSQTGYQIVIKKEWAEIPVVGLFKGVTIEKFFQRVLSGQNLSIISSDEKKVVVIRLFGDKKLDNMLSISGATGRTVLVDSDAVDIMDGQKISEIRELQAQHDAEMERWKNDPGARDPMDGQKLSDIRKLHDKHDIAMEDWKNDPDAADPMDGQKLTDIQKLQAEYDAEVEKMRNNPEAVDPLDGQKLADVRKLQAQHDLELERWKNDPEAVDPLDGQKLSDIRRLQAEYDAGKEQ
jgi:hypothetical protein